MTAHPDPGAPIVATLPGTGVIYRLMPDDRWYPLEPPTGAIPLDWVEADRLVPPDTVAGPDPAAWPTDQPAEQGPRWAQCGTVHAWLRLLHSNVSGPWPTGGRER